MLIDLLMALLPYVPFVALIVYFFVTKQWLLLKETAYALMLAAERDFKKNQGAEKFEKVIAELYENHVPKWLKAFISMEQVKAKLQEWYDEARELLKG